MDGLLSKILHRFASPRENIKGNGETWTNQTIIIMRIMALVVSMQIKCTVEHPGKIIRK